MRKHIEFYRHRENDFDMDLKNTYDMVRRKVLWGCLEKKDMPFIIVRLLNICMRLQDSEHKG